MTDQQEKAAWLAEHLMGWHLRDDDTWPRKWWYAAGDAIGRYLVSGSSGGGTAWNPFADIAQAKMVQAAMRARKWGVHIIDKGPDVLVVMAPGWPQGLPMERLWVEASSDSEAAAICEAAGRALGWPFDD